MFSCCKSTLKSILLCKRKELRTEVQDFIANLIGLVLGEFGAGSREVVAKPSNGETKEGPKGNFLR